MKPKQLPCDLCGRMCNIRSTIREGENKGAKVCPGCKGNPMQAKPSGKKSGKKLGGFFEEASRDVIKNPICQNCGSPIKALYLPHWNVAHILQKSVYKSVADHPDNFLILCADKDQANNCHEKFDSGIESRVEMPVFRIALTKFVKFKDECLERGKEYFIFEENL